MDRSLGTVLSILATAVLSTGFGLLGHRAGIPGGALLGAMLGAAGVSLARPVRFPAIAGTTARWLIGAVAGSAVTLQAVRQLGPQVVWGTVVSLLTIAAGLLGGVLAARVAGLDRPSGIVASAPGGLSELTGLANELDLRTDVVIAVHLVRRIVVALLMVALLVWT